MFLCRIDDTALMDGATAAERICPWRRSSVPDEARSASGSPVHDEASSPAASSSTNDPHLHSVLMTSADFSGTYSKSPEYIGDYATTTKPEVQPSRPRAQDLFNDPTRTSHEHEENADSDDAVTHMWTVYPFPSAFSRLLIDIFYSSFCVLIHWKFE